MKSSFSMGQFGILNDIFDSDLSFFNKKTCRMVTPRDAKRDLFDFLCPAKASKNPPGFSVVHWFKSLNIEMYQPP